MMLHASAPPSQFQGALEAFFASAKAQYDAGNSSVIVPADIPLTMLECVQQRLSQVLNADVSVIHQRERQVIVLNITSQESPATSSANKPAKIPRPCNSWILYRQKSHKLVRDANPTLTNNQLSTIISTMWRNESPAVKASWKAKADALKEQHSRKHPNYSYNPRRPSEKKRRMTKGKKARLAISQRTPPLTDASVSPSVQSHTSPMDPQLLSDFEHLNAAEPSQRCFDVPSSDAAMLHFDRAFDMLDPSLALFQPQEQHIQKCDLSRSVIGYQQVDATQFDDFFGFNIDQELMEIMNSTCPPTTVSMDMIQPAAPTSLAQIAVNAAADRPRMTIELERQQKLDAISAQDWYAQDS